MDIRMSESRKEPFDTGGANRLDWRQEVRKAARRRQIRRRRLSAVLVAGIVVCTAFLLALSLSGCGSEDQVVDVGPITTETTDSTGNGSEGSSTTTTPGNSSGTTTPGNNTATTAKPSDGTIQMSVYFTRGEKIAAAHRTIPRTEGVGAAAMKALLEGPNSREREEGGLGTVIPEGTAFLGLNIKDKIATVDLSREFASGGGTLSMTMRLAQVVYTLTQFPSVERVSFMLDGEPVDYIGGEGLPVDPPVGRKDYEDVTPAIMVESPTVGDDVRSPMRVWGTANTFEAVFTYNLVNANGLVIAEPPQGYVMATSGSGTRGTFDFTVSFDVDRGQRGSLIVFEHSAKDGSQVNLVEIPLDLLP